MVTAPEIKRSDDEGNAYGASSIFKLHLKSCYTPERDIVTPDAKTPGQTIINRSASSLHIRVTKTCWIR